MDFTKRLRAHLSEICGRIDGTQAIRDEQAQMLLDTVDRPSILVRLDGEIVAANKLFQQRFGDHKRQIFYDLPIKDLSFISYLMKMLSDSGIPSEWLYDYVFGANNVFFIKDTEDKTVIVSFSAFALNAKSCILNFVELSKNVEMIVAVLEEKEKYRALFHQSFDAVIVHDREGYILEVNQRACDLFGVDEKTFLKKNITDFMNSQNKEMFKNMYFLLQEKSFIRKQISYYNADQVKFDTDTAVTLVHYKRKKMVLARIRDLSEQQQITVEKDAAINRFREMMDLLPQTVFEMDSEGRLTYVNKFAFGMFGYDEKDFQKGLYAFDMISEKHRDEVKNAIRKLMRSNNELTVTEYMARRKDGSLFPVISYGAKIKEKRKTQGIRGVIIDITKRKESEEASLRLATAIDQVAESVVITDVEGKIVYVNASFEKLSGYKFDEVRGKTSRILKSGAQNDQFYSDMWKIISNGNVWHGHFINRRKNGSLYEEEETISPVTGRDGQIIWYVGVKRDVTEEVKREKKFRQSQKIQAIGTLAGGVAHDFNNILTAILGYTELALYHPDSGKQKERLMEIFQAGNRAKELVKQLLAFARQREGQFHPIMLDMVVKEVMKLIKALIPSDIEIKTQISDYDKRIMGDATQIHQILMNLCTNAAYAMRDEGGVLNVSLNKVEEVDGLKYNAQGFAELLVSDSGKGIPDTVIERIFEPYFTTKSMNEGTGLGLAVVHGIVESHKGRIEVESKEGEGTTFRIFFPLIAVKEETILRVDENIPGGHERILFVDDEPALCRMTSELLRALGYRVVASEYPDEALKIFEKEDFDLVISDYIMPRMSGLKLIQKLKSQKSDLKTIICSGHQFSVNEEEMTKQGVNGYCKKPFRSADLGILIRKVLDS